MATHGPLEVRVLGELELARDGHLLALPQSRKTRALLAYLVLTGRAHRRERLCELLWDVADDPRGALRWSLSRLRAIVDQPDQRRLVADRASCAFEALGVDIDLVEVQLLARRAGQAGTDELERALGRFRGELLEGLDFFDFDGFQAWLVAQREDASRLRQTLARALVERLADEPARAATHAMTLVQADPLDEGARLSLIRLLVRAGKHREAEQQVESARRAFLELGGHEPRALRELEIELRQKPPPAAPPPPAATRRSPLTRTTVHGLRLVGRQAELASLSAALDQAAERRRAAVWLVRGEPGVGKSRMLVALITEARKRRATVLEGCAYEAETGRAFGPWLDTLRRLPVAPAKAPSRDDLFRAVAELVASRSERPAPVLVALDDLQWFDEASAELLHFAVRSARELPVLFALTARDGELADNPAALRCLRGLRREGHFEELELGPLGRDETGELARLVERQVDTDQIFRDSGGNPLFTLEVARAGQSDQRGDWARSSGLSNIVRDRVDGLPPAAGDLLRWAAILGPIFRARILAELVALDAGALAKALDDLELHALIGGVVDLDDPGGTYRFSHDLVHRVVYGQLSVPRKRLMHGRAAQVLARELERDPSVAADLAHHAAEAGDLATAAAACARAARAALAVFARGQALALIRRGLRYAEAVPAPARGDTVAELEALRALTEAEPGPGPARP